MEDKEKLLHQKFHAEIELMHEETKQKIEPLFQKMKKSHYSVMALGGVMFLFMAFASGVAEFMIKDSFIRMIVFTAVLMGTVNQLFELLRHHREFSRIKREHDEFMSFDLSFEKAHSETEENPEQKTKLSN